MSDYRNRFPRKPFTKGGSDRFGGPKQMYKAECSHCHNTCEVPFRPNGKKPVFCSNCFTKDEGDAPRNNRRDPQRDGALRPSYDRPLQNDRSIDEVKSELKAMNEKLERLITIMQGVSVSDAVSKAYKPAKKAVAKKK